MKLLVSFILLLTSEAILADNHRVREEFAHKTTFSKENDPEKYFTSISSKNGNLYYMDSAGRSGGIQYSREDFHFITIGKIAKVENPLSNYEIHIRNLLQKHGIKSVGGGVGYDEDNFWFEFTFHYADGHTRGMIRATSFYDRKGRVHVDVLKHEFLDCAN